jgi:hypothetical protein
MSTAATIPGLQSQDTSKVPVSMIVNTGVMAYVRENTFKRKYENKVSNELTEDPRATDIFVGDLVAVVKSSAPARLGKIPIRGAAPGVIASVDGFPYAEEDAEDLIVLETEDKKEVANELTASHCTYSGVALSGHSARTGGASGSMVSVALTVFQTIPVAIHKNVNRPFQRVALGVVSNDRKTSSHLSNESPNRTGFGLVPVDSDTTAAYVGRATTEWCRLMNRENKNMNTFHDEGYLKEYTMSKRAANGLRVTAGLQGIILRYLILHYLHGKNTATQTITEIKKFSESLGLNKTSPGVIELAFSGRIMREISEIKDLAASGATVPVTTTTMEDIFADSVINEDIANEAMQMLCSGIADVVHQDNHCIGTVYSISREGADAGNPQIKYVTGFWTAV